MSNLFTAVSVEQQEIVAGGYYTLPSIPNRPLGLFATAFKGSQIGLRGAANSNWNGSNAGGDLYRQRVLTGGISFLQA